MPVARAETVTAAVRAVVADGDKLAIPDTDRLNVQQNVWGYRCLRR